MRDIKRFSKLLFWFYRELHILENIANKTTVLNEF